jgi:hypothetical protein
MTPQTADDELPVHAITIRFPDDGPDDVWEKLRRQAFDQRTSINALVVEAVRAKQS